MIHLINMYQLALHDLNCTLMKGQQSQYLWIESTTLPVCKNKRIQCHKSLTKIAYRGKSSMDWFYGYKLHVVMNQFGEIACSALSDKRHLKQRNKIETLFSLVKGKYHLVTSKARNISGFLSGIYASLCAYQLKHRNKPIIQIMESLA